MINPDSLMPQTPDVEKSHFKRSSVGRPGVHLRVKGNTPPRQAAEQPFSQVREFIASLSVTIQTPALKIGVQVDVGNGPPVITVNHQHTGGVGQKRSRKPPPSAASG